MSPTPAAYAVSVSAGLEERQAREGNGGAYGRLFQVFLHFWLYKSTAGSVGSQVKSDKPRRFSQMSQIESQMTDFAALRKKPIPW